jgi:hypothetical protein
VEAVEVVAMVGTTIVGVSYVPVSGCYRIGTAPGVDLPLGSSGEVILEFEFEIDVDGKVKRVRRQGPAMFADCISHQVEASAFHPTLWGTQVTYSLMVQPTS